MKKVLINQNMSKIPAFLFFSTTQTIDETINEIVSKNTVNSFKDDDNKEKDGNFTRCKLAVFFEGETPDHRKFSHSFSQKMKEKLPYTPVVGYYDEEKDDFIGHHKEQNIYGIVDPTREATFTTLDDGNTWCVCDIVLYTDRPDTTGKIASKIIGHKQSLELNANTLKYRVNYDENKHFKNFEFIDGDFLGVSVLGADEKPAFTGSQFFTLKDDSNIRQKIIDYCLKEKENLETQMNGDKTMDIKKFMELSWGEISTKVDQAVYTEYEKEAYCYMIDMYSDNAIFRFSSNIENRTWLMRIYFSVDEAGNVTLGKREEVRVTYETVEPSFEDNTETSNTSEYVSKEEEDKSKCIKDDEDKSKCETDTDEEKSKCVKDDEEKSKCIKDDEDKSKCVKDDEDKSKCTENSAVDNSTTQSAESNPSDNSVVENQPEAPVNANLVEEPNNENTEETNSGTSSFSSSEREEFENLKREKKINLINSYKEVLTNEEIQDFTDKIDNFSNDELELELLRKYKTYSSKSSNMRVFSFSDIKNETSNSLESFIKRNL